MVPVVGAGGEVLACADVSIWVYGWSRGSGCGLDVLPLLESRERSWDGVEDSLALLAPVLREHQRSIGARSVLSPGAAVTMW